MTARLNHKIVENILRLYTCLEKIKESDLNEEISAMPFCSFEGFSTNEEEIYRQYSIKLIQEQSWIPQKYHNRLKNYDYNTHTPMLSKYKKMISKWGRRQYKQDMSINDAIKILNS